MKSTTVTPSRLIATIVAALACTAVLFVAGCSSGGKNDVEANANEADRDTDEALANVPTDPGQGLTWNQVREWWVGKNRDPRYEPDDFLFGVGSAAYTGDRSLPEAEAAARNTLLAYFETRVESDMQSFSQQVITARNAAPAAIRESITTTQSVRAIVSGVAEGFQLVEQAISPKQDTCYSLIILNRKTFADNKKVEIEALKKQVKGYYEAALRARSSSAWFSAIGRYTATLPLLEKLVTLIKQYNLGKPPYYPAMSLDIDLGDVLEGMTEAAEQMTFAFRLTVTHLLQTDNGGENMIRAESTEAESAIINAFNTGRIAATVIRATPAFRDTPIDSIKRMSLDEIRGLLGDDVNYVIVGNLESYWVKEEVNPVDHKLHQYYRCRFDLQVIELHTGKTWPMALEQGPLGSYYRHQVAAGRASTNAAKNVASKIKERFTINN